MELRILRQYSVRQILIKIVGRLRRWLISVCTKLLDYILGSFKEEEAILKPVVKECIREAIFEEGVLKSSQL